MNDPRLNLYLSRLRAEFPSYVVICFPYTSPDDETIEHFIHLLDVPDDDLMPATWRSLDIADEIYQGGALRFCITTIDRETSSTHFPKELEAARWSQAQSAESKLVEVRPLSPGLEPAIWHARGSAKISEWIAADSAVRVRVLEVPCAHRPFELAADAGHRSRVYARADRLAASYAFAS